MRYVVMFSSGIGSWAAARRLVDSGVDPASILLLFADTRIEDEDNYRFLHEAAHDLGARLEILADGRTPWEVFRDVRFIGNTRLDACSKVLKREVIGRWLKQYGDVENDVLVYGLDWDEPHRIEAVARRWAPWKTRFPLNEEPFLSKVELQRAAWRRGILPPRLYAMGFPHANCGGFCVKAGRSQFELLYRKMPERYLQHEAEEQGFREFIGKDVSILRDRRGGETKPFTLRAFRESILGEPTQQGFDWGGCGCFAGDLDGSGSAHPGALVPEPALA